jgi:hypothetical protein
MLRGQAAGVNPGLTVPLPAPPHAAHMSPDERAAVREAMKKRASRPQHQALSPVRADALPAGSLTPARPAGAKPSQYAPAAAAAAGKKRLAGSHLGLSLALSAADGAVAGVGSLAGVCVRMCAYSCVCVCACPVVRRVFVCGCLGVELARMLALAAWCEAVCVGCLSWCRFYIC